MSSYNVQVDNKQQKREIVSSLRVEDGSDEQTATATTAGAAEKTGETTTAAHAQDTAEAAAAAAQEYDESAEAEGSPPKKIRLEERREEEEKNTERNKDKRENNTNSSKCTEVGSSSNSSNNNIGNTSTNNSNNNKDNQQTNSSRSSSGKGSNNRQEEEEEEEEKEEEETYKGNKEYFLSVVHADECCHSSFYIKKATMVYDLLESCIQEIAEKNTNKGNIAKNTAAEDDSTRHDEDTKEERKNKEKEEEKEEKTEKHKESGGMDHMSICLSFSGFASLIEFNPLNTFSLKLPKNITLVLGYSGEKAKKIINKHLRKKDPVALNNIKDYKELTLQTAHKICFGSLE
ncbi:hypothetical protein EMWEY_00034100, partial [Eimeria maxima]